MIGITDNRVEQWLGGYCQGCRQRREKLNRLGAWASRILRGRVDNAEKHLTDLMED